MRWYRTSLTQYARFSGRARRAEFWTFTLTNWIILAVLMVIDHRLGLRPVEFGYGPLTMVFGAAVTVPLLAVGSRRLHDTYRSGWWQLLMLIPLLGNIALIVLWCMPGDDGANRYGAGPAQFAPAGSTQL